MLSPTHSPTHTTNPLNRFVDSIFSYDGNVMLAALVSLLLVVLFVLLLHVYAKWFLAHAHHHRRRSSSITVSRVLGPTRFHNFPTFTFDLASLSGTSTKGLDPSVISAIPLFVYKSEEHNHGLECVICLSDFEDDDIGRNLPKCHHAFHVECIDMWLGSHSNCPICRAPAAVMTTSDGKSSAIVGGQEGNDGIISSETTVATVDGSAGLRLINGGSAALMETVIEISNSGDVQNVVMGSDCVSSPSSSSSSSSSLSSSSFGCSLKRILSRNKSENKVVPATNVSEI
ncbi:hypothetical protein FEM48_Zijuj02G0105400 [Ziziphus jujuba var. spinosa]|uniref:RING-type E3 ubiquitin transferase n=1 Tax=Ziziphus jujuba var. spinosa TaxID=714518 RepID=A0A978VV84_ZIZJJ|nr:hypothetical protein FEM48_Zijuj02G0105400 [Ziziphus jujuba var. spinosa]